MQYVACDMLDSVMILTTSSDVKSMKPGRIRKSLRGETKQTHAVREKNIRTRFVLELDTYYINKIDNQYNK